MVGGASGNTYSLTANCLLPTLYYKIPFNLRFYVLEATKGSFVIHTAGGIFKPYTCLNFPACISSPSSLVLRYRELYLSFLSPFFPVSSLLAH